MRRGKPEDRPIIHAVPLYTEDGALRWFRTMTEAKAFAKQQQKDMGHGAYRIYSAPFRSIAKLLENVTEEDFL